jgi:hypothetical protein
MSTGFIGLDVLDSRAAAPASTTPSTSTVRRADDWLFMELEPVSAAGARGVYRGRSDRTGASRDLVQENLMRPPPPSG